MTRGRLPMYRELLTTRVMSVDEYEEEMRDPRRRSPNEREIPVPLWPGESLQQFERDFCRWLASQRLSLASMREDPMTERNCRLQFALMRVRPQRGREESQRPSRSRSPSFSPPRRFNAVQQPQPYPVRREDRTYTPSFERRISPDNGRFASRQGDRQHERSYSRERPHARHVAPPESSRTYDRQPALHSDTRRRQDSRASSPPTAPRQHVGEVQRLNKSPSRSPPPEAPRTYDRQPALHHDPSRRQDSRAASSPTAPRQHVGEVQRWNKSPSRSPRYSRPASPPRSDRPPLQVRRSTSPHLDIMRKQLLGRRVISLEAFRDEMYKLRNGVIREDDLKRPHETMVRIPVILWPGESMAQYTQKFERWLDSRNMPLPSIRDHPARERSLWHRFAYTRAGTSEIAEPARPRARSRSPSHVRTRSRSRSRSSSRSIRRSSERGRSPMNAPYAKDIRGKKEFAPTYIHEEPQRPKSPPSTIAPPENLDGKNRSELLAKRIVPLDVFQKEVDQNHGVGAEGNVLPAIPIPLHPGESMGLYGHRFWTWLNDFNETNDSLRGNPARERRFRMAFAYLRVNKPRDSAITGDQIARAQRAQGFRPNVDTPAKIPLGVLKSAPTRLAMKAKRLADDSERNEREEPDSKRARVDAEEKTRAHVMPQSPSSLPSAITEQKRSATSHAMTSESNPRSTLAPTTTTTFARPLTSMVAATSSSVGSVRPSMPSKATSASVFRGEVRTSRPLAPPIQRRPITIITKSVAPQTETVTPHSLPARVQNTKPAAAVTSKSASSNMGVSALLQSSTAPLQKMIIPRLGKAEVETTAPLQKIKPRPEQASKNKRVDPQAASRSLLAAWHTRGSESGSSTPSSGPFARSEPPSWSAAAAFEAPKTSAAEMPRESPTPAEAAAARSLPIAERTPSTIESTTANAGTEVIENGGADTDAAQSEPEMSDAVSDDGEVHDGDVMNPDGCCCTKCMRKWARTLTDRMDQLERNVQSLKCEVITRTTDQATTVK